jgi:hypothetical protein
VEIAKNIQTQVLVVNMKSLMNKVFRKGFESWYFKPKPLDTGTLTV